MEENSGAGKVQVQHSAQVNNDKEIQALGVVEKTEWSLGDVLEHMPEETTGKLGVFSSDPRVCGGEVVVDLGADQNTVSFQTDDGQLIDPVRAEEMRFVHNVSDTEGVSVETYRQGDLVIRITSHQGDTKKNVKIEFGDRGFAKIDLSYLGLRGIFENNDLPDVPSEEFAQKIIKDKKIEVGRREIPVGLARTKDDIAKALESPPEGTVDVYHGSGLGDILSLARIGLFSEGGDIAYRPILSADPTGLPVRLAMNEWDGYDREDASGYGAIAVFRVKPDMVEVSSDVGGERLYHPSNCMTDGDEIYRLQKKVKRNLPKNSPRYLGPENIEKIILIKQTEKDSKDKV